MVSPRPEAVRQTAQEFIQQQQQQHHQQSHPFIRGMIEEVTRAEGKRAVPSWESSSINIVVVVVVRLTSAEHDQEVAAAAAATFTKGVLC